MKNSKVKDYVNSIVNELAEAHGMGDEEFNILSTNGLMVDGMVEHLETSIYNYHEAERERHIVTAERRDSLVKHSGRFKKDLTLANPAIMESILVLPMDEVLDNSNKIRDTYIYQLDKDLDIKIDDYYFNLEYDVELRCHEIEDDYSFSARYLIDDTNDIDMVNNPEIKTIRYREHQREYIALILNIRQFKREHEEYTFSSEITDRNFGVTFEDELADINIYYKEERGSNGEYIKINTSPQITNIATDEKTMFYKFIRDKELMLMNRFELGNFHPEIGSKIKIEKIICKGEEGNFTYDGGFVTSTTEDGIIARIQPRGPSVKGENPPELEELRQRLIDYNATRGGLTSTDCIERRLRTLGSEFKVVKYVDDIQMRVYNIFGVMFDKFNHVVPTNTMDLVLDLENLNKIDSGQGEYEVADFIIPEDVVISINEESSATSFGYYGSIGENGDSNHKYAFPYKMVYNRNTGEESLNYVKLFELVLEREYNTDFEYINKSLPITYIVNSVKFRKTIDEKYEISFKLLSNTADPVDFIHKYKVDEEQKVNGDGDKLFIGLGGEETTDSVEIKIDTEKYGGEIVKIEDDHKIIVTKDGEIEGGNEFILDDISNIREVAKVNDIAEEEIDNIKHQENITTITKANNTNLIEVLSSSGIKEGDKFRLTYNTEYYISDSTFWEVLAVETYEDGGGNTIHSIAFDGEELPNEVEGYTIELINIEYKEIEYKEVIFDGKKVPDNYVDEELKVIEYEEINLKPIMVNVYDTEPEDEDCDDILSTGYLKCYLKVYCEEYEYGYLEFNLTDYVEDGDYYVYKKKLDIIQDITSSGRINFEMDRFGNVEESDRTTPVEDLKFKLFVTVNEDVDYDYYGEINEDFVFHLEPEEEYSISNVYGFEGDLFKDLTHLNKTQVVPESYDDEIYRFKMMPLVGYDYFHNDPIYVMELINQNRSMLNEVFYEIQDDYEISLLFINTYGMSQYYLIGLNRRRLDSVDLGFNFTIAVDDDSTITKNDLIYHILEYFESIDFMDDEEFHVSRLIADLKDVYERIEFVEFDGINDFSREFQLIRFDDSNFDNSSVPEYPNIRMVEDDDRFIPDINIDMR